MNPNSRQPVVGSQTGGSLSPIAWDLLLLEGVEPANQGRTEQGMWGGTTDHLGHGIPSSSADMSTVPLMACISTLTFVTMGLLQRY